MIEAVTNALQSGRLNFTTMADSTGVLLDLHGHQVMSLNDTATAIVGALIDGASDVQSVAQRIAREFEIDPDTAAGDVDDFLRELTALL